MTPVSFLMGYSFSGAAVPGTEKTSSAPIMRKKNFFMDAAPRKCEPDLSIASGENGRLKRYSTMKRSGRAERGPENSRGGIGISGGNKHV
jgi:hypothetical protein